MRPDRRQFLKQTANASLLAGVGPFLAGCGGASEDATDSASLPARTDKRTYYFNFANAHPDSDFFLVAGGRHLPLAPLPKAMLNQAASTSIALQQAGQRLTHVGVDLELSNNIHMCFVKGVPRAGSSRRAGEWDLHGLFHHVPAGAVTIASQKVAQSCGRSAPDSLRSAFLACTKSLTGSYVAAAASSGPLSNSATSTLIAANTNCIPPEYDEIKDSFDLAMSLALNHPEVSSFHGPTLSYVMQKFVCSDPRLLDLAISIETQGNVATTSSGWARLVPAIDPDTNQPKMDSKGLQVYFVEHTRETLQYTGVLIQSVLKGVKNDPMLGADISELTGDQKNAALTNKLWVTRDGKATRLSPAQATPTAFLRVATNEFTSAVIAAPAPATQAFTMRDTSSHAGYSVENVAGSGRTVSFKVENWYVRFLGLHVNFLDASGKLIAFDSLPQATKDQFTIKAGNDTYTRMYRLLNPQGVILGIPVPFLKEVENFTLTLPQNAASIQLLAGGLGSGSNDYPETIGAGTLMTVLVNLAVPGIFLMMDAVNGIATFAAGAATDETVYIEALERLILLIEDLVQNSYDDSDGFKNLIIPMGFSILKRCPKMFRLIKAAITSGEEEAATEDLIPFGVGLALQAVMALGIAAQMAVTSAETANSPRTYVTRIDAAHDLTVTINHDPKDVAGFPATATSYVLIATCDNGTPTNSSKIAMQMTTRTAPLTYVFRGLPAGGQVTVTAHFFSKNDYLVGVGSVTLDNTLNSASITIEERLVPLTPTTVYEHKQKLGLDVATGSHIWIPTKLRPAAVAASCLDAPGNLCSLVSIAVSETFGSVGYAWQSSSRDVRDFASRNSGQLNQFANVSFTDTPQSSYITSNGGFSTPVRLAYSRVSPSLANGQNFYIDSSTGRQIVRRINLVGVQARPNFDQPGSNMAVGRFNFPSDAFLIHPSGKLISINVALSKFEVLVPSAVPVADNLAPVAQAYSGPGQRSGLLDAPVSAAIEPNGAILVLEQNANRIQAFDTGANPVKFFGPNSAKTSFLQLKPQPGNVTYLDLAVEVLGYVYVLSYSGAGIYSLDIYTPQGTLLCTTPAMNAAKLAIDLFRNIYTLNFEVIAPYAVISATTPDGFPTYRQVSQSVGSVTEPSISQWIPSTPNALIGG